MIYGLCLRGCSLVGPDLIDEGEIRGVCSDNREPVYYSSTIGIIDYYLASKSWEKSLVHR